MNEYAERGEYHRYLNPSWSYYPYYIQKVNFVKTYIKNNISKSSKILDAGCGEGVLVEELIKEGYNAVGIDINYCSRFVIMGDIKNLPFSNESFDLVLCLDVLEHINFNEQEKAIKEIYRVIKHGGEVIFSLPNLAYITSRIRFFLFGELTRTAKHPGDRPIREYILMPYFPDFCFLNILVCKKGEKEL